MWGFCRYQYLSLKYQYQYQYLKTVLSLSSLQLKYRYKYPVLQPCNTPFLNPDKHRLLQITSNFKYVSDFLCLKR